MATFFSTLNFQALSSKGKICAYFFFLPFEILMSFLSYITSINENAFQIMV